MYTNTVLLDSVTDKSHWGKVKDFRKKMSRFSMTSLPPPNYPDNTITLLPNYITHQYSL